MRQIGVPQVMGADTFASPALDWLGRDLRTRLIGDGVGDTPPRGRIRRPALV